MNLTEGRGRLTSRTPIQVMHLNPAFKLDGPGRGILALMRYLPRDRVRPEACSLSVADPTMERHLRDQGIQHTNLGLGGIWDLRSLPRMVRLLKARRIDILHTHLTRADWIGRIAARLAGTPVVLSTIRNLNREVYQAECGRVATVIAPLLDRMTGRWADALIAVSEDVKAWLIDEGYPRGKIHCIPNAVDLDGLKGLTFDSRLKSSLLGAPEDAPVVGTVALFKEQKGHRYLVEAAAQISRKYPAARFLLVGSGPTYSIVREQVRTLNLESAFVFVGQTEDVIPYLKVMDVFVLPSLWEGMPRALMEAMASCIPVVGTNVSGIRDLIEDGVTGRLVPARDSGSLAEAVMNLLDHRMRARQMAEAGRRLVLERHDAATSAVTHAQFYEELLDSRGRT